MVAIPESVDTRLKVEIAIEDKKVKPEIRSYLGISGIGKKCARMLWYEFRICSIEEITPKQQRLFSRGHKEEPIIIADLESVGVLMTSNQQTYIAGSGHIKGHSDGTAINIPDAPKTEHLAEFKTASDKNFKKLRKEGLQKFSPAYYGQIVVYMHLGKLKRTLYIVVNKNTDERLYMRFEADPEHAKYLLSRGVDIISTEVPPEKIGNSTWFECKWCKHQDVCHFGAEVYKTCRTCTHCDIHDEGVWKCSKYNIELAFEQQLKPCKKYSLLNTLNQ